MTSILAVDNALSNVISCDVQRQGPTYNDRNELTRIDYPDPSYVSFAYNDAGARTQMVDSTGTTTYSYDNLYRLTSVTFPGSRTVSYGYDDASRRTSITFPVARIRRRTGTTTPTVPHLSPTGT